MEPHKKDSSSKEFDLIAALKNGNDQDQRKARLWILEKNINLNELPVSVILLAARRNDINQVYFLVACGAIPWETDYGSIPNAQIQREYRHLCTAFSLRRYIPQETIMTSIVKSMRGKSVEEQINAAIRSVKQIVFASMIRKRHNFSPFLVRNWRGRMEKTGLKMTALQTSLYTMDGLDVILSANREDLVLEALPKVAHMIHEYKAAGGWNLFEKALILGWQSVVDVVKRDFSQLIPAGYRLAQLAIDDANPHDFCDVEILFEHSKYVKLWAHYSIIAVRCPKLAEEIDNLHRNETGQDPFVPDASRGQKLIQEVESGTIPSFGKRPLITVTMKETYSVMKALLQFLYLDFVPADTWRLFLGDSNVRELQGAAVYYKLPALAQSVSRHIKQEPFPCFFKTNESRWEAQEIAAATGKRPAQKVALPTLQGDFRMLCSPLEYPNPEAVNTLLRLGADRIIKAEGKFVLTFDWMLKSLNPHFARLSAAGMRETRESVIQMGEESYEAIWTIIMYIITGTLDPTISASAALEVIPLTEYFEIPHLAKMAEKNAVETAQIDDDVALKLAQFAIDTSSPALLDRCIKYFADNPQSLTLCAQKRPDEFWSCISEENLELIVSRLPGDLGKITGRNLKMMRMNYEEELSKHEAHQSDPVEHDEECPSVTSPHV